MRSEEVEEDGNEEDVGANMTPTPPYSRAPSDTHPEELDEAESDGPRTTAANDEAYGNREYAMRARESRLSTVSHVLGESLEEAGNRPPPGEDLCVGGPSAPLRASALVMNAENLPHTMTPPNLYHAGDSLCLCFIAVCPQNAVFVQFGRLWSFPGHLFTTFELF